jgi:hypothetical protein
MCASTTSWPWLANICPLRADLRALRGRSVVALWGVCGQQARSSHRFENVSLMRLPSIDFRCLLFEINVLQAASAIVFGASARPVRQALRQ